MQSSANTPVTPKSHAKLLAADDYVRQRLAPGMRDLNYVILKDLVEFLRQVAPKIQGKIFDYGCGGAPYRPLFAHCQEYVAADIEKNPAVDCLLKADGTTGQLDNAFDAVLSTQVLEHIRDPEAYLSEAKRIMRPGGKLLLTTHGMFEEHGCPDDFMRWTGRGLEQLVTKSGFQIVSGHKLSTGLRGQVQIINQMSLQWGCPNKPIIHLPLSIVRKTHRLFGVRLLNWFADLFPEQAIAASSGPASVYSCVAVLAEKR